MTQNFSKCGVYKYTHTHTHPAAELSGVFLENVNLGLVSDWRPGGCREGNAVVCRNEEGYSMVGGGDLRYPSD